MNILKKEVPLYLISELKVLVGTDKITIEGILRESFRVFHSIEFQRHEDFISFTIYDCLPFFRQKQIIFKEQFSATDFKFIKYKFKNTFIDIVPEVRLL